MLLKSRKNKYMVKKVVFLQIFISWVEIIVLGLLITRLFLFLSINTLYWYFVINNIKKNTRYNMISVLEMKPYINFWKSENIIKSQKPLIFSLMQIFFCMLLYYFGRLKIYRFICDRWKKELETYILAPWCHLILNLLTWK